MLQITRIKNVFPAALVFALMAGCQPPHSLESISVSGASMLPKGGTISLKASGVYSDGTQNDLTKSASWTSSDPGVAIVSAGTVSGLGKGMAVINAIYADRIGSVAVTVTDGLPGPALLSITVSPAAQTIAKGTKLHLSALGIYDDGSAKDVTSSVAWSSSSPGLAVVSNDGDTRGVATAEASQDGDVTFTASLGGKSGSALEHVTPAEVVSIDIGPDSPSIAVKTRLRLTPVGHLSDGNTQDLSDSVTWASANESIASISNAPASRGLALAVAPGSVQISAFLPGGAKSGSAVLQVTPAKLTLITLIPNPVSVPAGLKQQFTAAGTFDDKTAQDLTDQVSWSSDDESSATVSNDDGSRGMVTGKKEKSEANISANFDYGDGQMVTGQALVKVTDALVTAISVSASSSLATPGPVMVAKGLSQRFLASGMFTDGSMRQITDVVTWASSDTGVATISNTDGSHGLATAVAEGASTISASLAGVGGVLASGSAALLVTPKELAAISVSPMDTKIAQGATQQFSAMGSYTDGSAMDISNQVNWDSSDPSIAIISNTDSSRGLATAVGPSSAPATITASLNGKSGSAHLSVN